MSGIEIFPDLEQGTPEWLAARAGIATASRFKDILTKPKEKGARWSKTAEAYAHEVAGEVITGEPNPVIETWDMRRGKEMEPQIRADYEFMTGTSVQQVGFVRRGRAGYSPDGLVGNDGAVEFKSHKPSILIPMILGNETPEQHVAQTQGGLWIADREWIDLACFWPKLPPFVRRVYRDEVFISALAQTVADFSDLVDETVEKVLRYGETGSIYAIAAE